MSCRHNDNDSEEDDSDYDQKDRKNKLKVNHPRFIKNSMEDIDVEQIIVNLSKTHYEVIESVVEELGWIVERSKKSHKWDIMWTDTHIEAHELFKLNDHQKISHFPAIYVLARKNLLGRGLMKMGKIFPNDYNYFPQTWSIPADYGELIRYNLQQQNESKKTVYIFKPEASSQGKGIILVQQIEELEGKTGIVQIYVNDPYLIEGLKFDLRIYVLISGCNPMRIYVFEEGLARFATESYQKAKKKNMKDVFIHLTNYAINKDNKKFIFNTSDANMSKGHKRSLTWMYQYLLSKGVDVQALKTKIDRLIIKTLLVGKPMLEHLYSLSQPDNIANDHCFQILGFDVLLNEQLDPILLEVNHTPSFATDTPLDKYIKRNLIKETLLLLNVNVSTKKMKIEKKIESNERRSMRKSVKLTQEEKEIIKRQIENQKDIYQRTIMKGFRKVYPILSLKRTEFSDIQIYSQKMFNEQEGLKNKEPINSSTLVLKNSLSLRPNSLEGGLSFNKKKVNQKIISGNYSIGLHLPNISPKKQEEKNIPHSAMLPKKIIKNNELKSDEIFQKYDMEINHSKLKLKKKILESKSIFASQILLSQNYKNEGTFVQQKPLKLAEMISFKQKSSLNNKIEEIAQQCAIKLAYQDKNKNSNKNTKKNFLDWMEGSTQQKSTKPQNYRNQINFQNINTMKMQNKQKSNLNSERKQLLKYQKSQRKSERFQSEIQAKLLQSIIDEEIQMMKSLCFKDVETSHT